MMCASAKAEARSNSNNSNIAGGDEVIVTSAVGALDGGLTAEEHDNDNSESHVLEQLHSAVDAGGEGEEREESDTNVLGVVSNDVPVSVSASVGVPVSVGATPVGASTAISVAPASSLIAQAASTGPSIPSGDNNPLLMTQPMLDLSRQTLVLHEGSSIPGGGVTGDTNSNAPQAQTTNIITNTVPKRKRRQYASEEERRTARILKNRRTAEESRQRRLKKMKDLEEYAKNAAAREQKLLEEITGLRQTVTAQAQLIENLRTMQTQDIEQRNLDMKRVKLRK